MGSTIPGGFLHQAEVIRNILVIEIEFNHGRWLSSSDRGDTPNLGHRCRVDASKRTRRTSSDGESSRERYFDRLTVSPVM